MKLVIKDETTYDANDRIIQDSYEKIMKELK